MENNDREAGYKSCACDMIDEIDEQIDMICEHFKDAPYSLSADKKCLEKLEVYRYMKGFVRCLSKQNTKQ